MAGRSNSNTTAADTSTVDDAEVQATSGKIKVPNDAGDVITMRRGVDVVAEFKVSDKQLVTFEDEEQRDMLLGAVPGAELVS